MAVPGLFRSPLNLLPEIRVRVSLGSALLLSLACSDRSLRSGRVPEPADFLPPAADTAYDDTAHPDSDGEQPRLVLRCEQGRLGAYLIVGTAAEVDSAPIDADAVEVRLDSAPSC